MPDENASSQELRPHSILSFAKDLPNICSLSGLACTLLAIYFSITGLYAAAMIGMIWAVAFDWADGLIARRMKGRTGDDRIFGGQLDLLIDIVSYGVAPAILLLSYGNFEFIYMIGAFVMLAASALRLSYFSTFGLEGGTHYKGLALDNNSIILVFIFLFESFFSQGIFSIILYASALSLAALNVSQLKTPKFSGNPVNVIILATYTVVITAIYGWKML
ncbi:MAG: CDP-alcohol phosphatidyltransferase [Gammaproteobacteria bacterium]|nr:CDP-alcohol phosphatidyltransferase [Gammaproteobacteria bacterium]